MNEPPVAKKLMDQLDIEAVKHRSVTGVLAITGRTFFLQLVTFVATFLLTVFLAPEEYGVFFVISAIVNFLVYFSDIGLAAALIQKKGELKDEELATTFTIQQLLVVGLLFVAMVGSGFVARFYQLSVSGLWLFRSLVIAFFLSSLKTIPSVRLERNLEFGKLIIPQLVETVLFYAVAVYLAWAGYGITSFTIAVLVRGVAGLITMYSLSPWQPRFLIKKSAAHHLLSFGVPFQLNSVLGLVKDDLLTAFLGKVLPLAQVGFLGWAQRWALFPLRIFMDSINKVTFPAYARLQHKKRSLAAAIEKSLLFVSLFIFPMVVGLATTAPAFVRLIPRYQKWEPALIALGLFAFTSLWASISTTLTNALAAVGKIKLNLKLMMMWTTLTWIFTPILVVRLGFNGAAFASAIVACTSIIPMILVKRILPVKITPNVMPSLVAAILVGGVTYRVSPMTQSLLGLFVLIAGSAILYALLMIVLQGKRLKNETQSLVAIIKR